MGSPLFFFLFLLASFALRPGALAGAPRFRAPRLGSQVRSEALLRKAVSGLLRADVSPQAVAARWHLPPAPRRERKAGCKSFYWKTLTSC